MEMTILAIEQKIATGITLMTIVVIFEQTRYHQSDCINMANYPYDISKDRKPAFQTG
jgi:hypothetical protein